jgi:hypothetical protein
MNWLWRIFGKYEEPPKPPVMCGIYLSGRDYFLCSPTNEEIRGVKIVTIPEELYWQYKAAEELWLKVQGQLDALPKSLRPRRKRAAKKLLAQSEV